MKSTKKAETDGLVFAEGATGSFGDVEIPDEDFEPKNVRVRISMFVPGDVLAKLRELAKAKGKPYQTLANDILRAAVMGETDAVQALSARVARLEGQMGTGRQAKRAAR